MGKIWAIVYGTGFLLGVIVCYLGQGILGSWSRPDPSVTIQGWLTVILSGAAVIVSLSTLLFTRRKGKRDAFLSVHEKMITADLQEGRRLLFDVESPEAAEKLLENKREDYQKVNMAMAMYDVLCLYVERGYVRRDLVMETWGPGLANARIPGRHFIAHRTKLGIPSTWRNFNKVSLEAAILFQDKR